ncbi:MAG TPA: YbaK/EbsC family protein [Thermotogota bacterium]|nr:YbaK/EbsC family protein [Thermotogota bacterium]HNR62640.1 YbaK/EbsC family protein [Thermotogota bacterium]HOZ11015.1 YbaK/EbsC family protein [Thermotogota bacterium]HPH09397.1 YbaK/EbsC family protein [Thermotogota bacterium]HPX97479.1 YbaK/EbsC family protein [Thermotogota bacterium]
MAFETRVYTVDESDLSARSVAQKLGIRVEQTVKTIVLKGNRSGVFVCLLQGHREVDFKRLVTFLPDTMVDTVDPERLLSLTGYIRGGVSPFGMIKTFPFFLDRLVLREEWISCSAGKRGLQIWMLSADLSTLTGAAILDFSKP